MVVWDDKQTLCHVLDGSRMLLKRANRGVSFGKWNAPGGKMEDEETPEQCVYREVEEETGLKVKDLFKHGILRFYTYGKDKIDVTVHLYSAKEFSGNLRASDAGEVKWFDMSDIPMNDMWDDDNYWLELMLNKRRFDADFYFDKASKKVVEYKVHFIE